MQRAHYARFLLLTCALLFAGVSGAQPWTLAGPDDANQPTGYQYTSDMIMTSDLSKGFYVAYSQYAWSSSVLQLRASVRHWDGNVWKQVGQPTFSAGAMIYESMSIAAGTGGTPYISYADFTVGRKAVVQKFDGTNWVPIGSALSPGTAEKTSLAIDFAGNPYIAYIDSPATRKVTVKKWDGNTWQTIGATNFTPANVNGLKLLIDRMGKPRLLVQYTLGGFGLTTELFTYDGNTWVSSGAPSGNSVINVSDMALMKNDTVIVAFTNLTNNSRVSVKKFDGTNWVSVGGSFVTSSSSDKVQISVDSNNTTYLFCKYDTATNGSNAYYPGLRRFNGTGWEIVGPDSLIVRRQTWDNELMALDSAGTPHVMLYDYKNRLMKLTPGGWQELGNSSGITNEPASIVKLATTPDGKTAFAIMGGDNTTPYPKNSQVLTYNNGWVPLSNAGTPLRGVITDIAVNANGLPWIILRDSGSYNRFSVYRYNGTGWTYTGLRDTASIITMTADNSGNILVLALSANSQGTRLHTFNGTSWSKIQVFNSGSSYRYFRLSTAPNGTPYILVGSHISTHPNYLYAFGVYKYDGTSWITQGSVFNTANGTYFQGDPDLAVDSAGVPYVCFLNTSNYIATVQKYDSANYAWLNVVAPAASPGPAYSPAIRFAQDGSLYMYYGDRSTNPVASASVKRLSGSTWQNVGALSFSNAQSEIPSLALLNNRLLLAYSDGAAFAYKYDCLQPATINTQPRDTVVCAAANARFVVNGSGITAYLWQYNSGQGWLNADDLSGASGIAHDTLKINSVGRALNGTRFRCILSNTCGGSNITETALLMVDTTVWPAPLVSIAADKLYTCAGLPLTLRATATNKGVAYNYSWYKNGTAVTGINDSVYTATFNQGDSVRCMFTRISACSLPPVDVNSTVVNPEVNPLQAVTVSIANTTGNIIIPGISVTFTSTITNGGKTPQYQWLRNGNPISGANSDTYTTASLVNGDIISLQVKRADTCAKPNTVVSTPLTMTQWPASIQNSATNETTITLYPQPASDHVNLSGLSGLKPGAYDLRLFDVMGREVYYAPMYLEKGTNTRRIVLPGTLLSGTYRLKLSSPEQILTLPLLIAR